MKQNQLKTQFVVCVKNDGYLASLEFRKIYQVVPDNEAVERKLIRIVDESGEDYLVPAELFVPIDLPEAVEKALAMAA